MAVVFISPKQRQKTFILGIAVALLLFLAVFSAGVFFAPVKNVNPTLVFNKPKVSINMSVFDAEKFKILEPFIEMEFQYSYKAISPDKKRVEGFVSAVSMEEARKLLTSKNYDVSEIKEVEVGRENPFVPYFEAVKKETAKAK